MKFMLDALNKINKTVADPVSEAIPGANITMISESGTSLKLRISFGPSEVQQARDKYGDSFRIWSVLESKYVNLAEYTNVDYR